MLAGQRRLLPCLRAQRGDEDFNRELQHVLRPPCVRAGLRSLARGAPRIVPIEPEWAAAILALGCLAILIENVLRTSGPRGLTRGVVPIIREGLNEPLSHGD